MGKLLSRTAAAKMLGCNPQTIVNYVRYGLIDELHRELNGRDGFYYDEDQLRALAPDLSEVSQLEERIARRKEDLHNQERELVAARDKARRELLRASGGQRTFNRFRQLAMAAYDYAGPVNPHADRFTAKVLEKLLSLEDFDTVCRELQASPYKVDVAVSRIARRMCKMRNIVTEINAVRREQEKVLEENARLRNENARLRGAQREPGSDFKKDEKHLSFKAVPIEGLPLSSRTKGALMREGINTLYDIVAFGSHDLGKLYGLGPKGIKELEEVLRPFGLPEGR